MGATARAVMFRAVQVLWSPIALIGYVSFVVRIVRSGRRSKSSLTTFASLFTRWMQHELGTRVDEPCERLVRVLPTVPPVALRLTSEGTLLAHALTGYVPPLYRYPYEGNPPMAHQSVARTTFFDAALSRHLGDIHQLVVLGAGYDTRSFRMPERLRCFEVDAPDTQDTKREMLPRAGLDAGRITFVPADFMRDNWLEKLVEAGFDPARRTFFLWEAVTMYLDRQSVEATLRTIARTAGGSVVAFDYLSEDLVRGGSLYWRYGKAILNAIGEPWTFGMQTAPPPAWEHAVALLASCGLSLEEHRNVGGEDARTPAAGGFVTAIVPGS